MQLLSLINTVSETGKQCREVSFTDPLTQLHLVAHLLGDPDAAAVEPLLASVARDHELVVVRLPTDAPKTLRVVVLRVPVLKRYFCSTNGPLATTRWVRLTFSSLCPINSKQRC